MKKKVMEKWVEALRSGKYKQGKGFLNTNNEYCCLGVLCELASKEKICKKEVRKSDNRGEYGNIGGEWLPEKVMEWAGMETQTGEVNGERMSLAHYNDSGHDFQTIADIIEFNYKDL